MKVIIVLLFSYDEHNIYSLKISESYNVPSYQEKNVIRLKNIDKDNINQQFVLTNDNPNGIPIQLHEHYDFLNDDSPNIVSLLSHEFWDDLTNFKLMFIKNTKEENNFYLFQDFLNNENITINSSEDSGVIEIEQRVYITQRDKDYQLITITQDDLLQDNGLPLSSVKFMKYGESKYTNSIFYETIEKNTTKSFYIKLDLRKLDIDGIFRDLVIRCSQTTA